MLRGANGPQAVIGPIAKAIPGDGVEVHAVIGDQQVKAPFALLGVVVDAEVKDKVVNGGVIKHLVAAGQQLLKLLPKGGLQPVAHGTLDLCTLAD